MKRHAVTAFLFCLELREFGIATLLKAVLKQLFATQTTFSTCGTTTRFRGLTVENGVPIGVLYARLRVGTLVGYSDVLLLVVLTTTFIELFQTLQGI